jgi:hypothetical protein
VQNIVKATLFAVLVSLSALQTRALAASTNIVQNITFQFTGYEQGPTNQLTSNITAIAVNVIKFGTKDVIKVIGEAIPTNFSSSAKLVYITRVNANTNINGFEIRDGSNRVDVTSFLAGTGRNTNDLVRSLLTNRKLGFSAGVGYSTFRLVVTNVPPASLKVDGFAIARHATIHDRLTGLILGVDTLNASLAGTGTDTNGVPFVTTGTLEVIGSVVEKR